MSQRDSYGFETYLADERIEEVGKFPVFRLLSPILYRTKAGELIKIPARYVTDLRAVGFPIHRILGVNEARACLYLYDYLCFCETNRRDQDLLLLEALLYVEMPLHKVTVVSILLKLYRLLGFGRKDLELTSLRRKVAVLVETVKLMSQDPPIH